MEPLFSKTDGANGLKDSRNLIFKFNTFCIFSDKKASLLYILSSYLSAWYWMFLSLLTVFRFTRSNCSGIYPWICQNKISVYFTIFYKKLRKDSCQEYLKNMYYALFDPGLNANLLPDFLSKYHRLICWESKFGKLCTSKSLFFFHPSPVGNMTSHWKGLCSSAEMF